MMRLFSNIRDRWQGETDGAGLALVRILVAFSVLMEMLQLGMGDGVTELIIEPQIHFKYRLFEWVGPPQGMMPAVFVWSLAVVAAMVLIGWRTRWTASLMAAGYVYWFLIDAANYTDHGYLVCLLSVLVACLPTNRWGSADAYMGREKRTLVPGWCVELVRAQLSLVYLFFALSLLNSDWLNGAPLVAWVETETEISVVQWLVGKQGAVRAIAWMIPVLYLLAIPCLWWKRTRWLGLVAVALFHVWDSLTFGLSVSPWLLSGASLVFCDTAGLRRWSESAVNRLPRGFPFGACWDVLCRLGLLVDACVSWFDDTPLVGEAKSRPRAFVEPVQSKGPAPLFPISAQCLVVSWLLLQIWLPIRYATQGMQPDWTDMATTFAWRGQHRDKQCELKMSIIQPTLKLRWQLDPQDEFPVPQALFFTEEKLEKLRLSEGTLKDLVSGPEDTQAERFAALQIPAEEAQQILANHRGTLKLRLAAHQYEQLLQRPELLRQYAHQIGAILGDLLGEEIQVLADLKVRLNQRPWQQMLTDGEEEDLQDFRTANDLAANLPVLTGKLPTNAESILVAKEWNERRRLELEQDFDIVLDSSKPRGEPVKLPPFTDEDERWYQEKFVRNK